MTAVVWFGVMTIGGAASLLRFLVDRRVMRRVRGTFPYGTLTVNLTGAFALGLISDLTLSSDAALIVETAAIGSYTTFSTWVFETQRLAEDRRTWLAVANIVVSVVLGVALVAIGRMIGAGL